MPVSRDLKTLLIHIPKNAGESMENKLGMYGMRDNPMDNLWGVQDKVVLQHLTATQIRNAYLSEAEFSSYFKFAFVRNPWDKAVSEYHWYLRYGEPLSFSDWVRTLPDKLAHPGDVPVLGIGHDVPQHAFLFDENGKLLVDFVGRFEYLQEDFAQVSQVLGIHDPILPKQESTSSVDRKPYRDYYDEATRAFIGNLYQNDIELFGYDYDTGLPSFSPFTFPHVHSSVLMQQNDTKALAGNEVSLVGL